MQKRVENQASAMSAMSECNERFPAIQETGSARLQPMSAVNLRGAL